MRRLLLLLLLCLALPCVGEDSVGWRHIRGPEYDGHTVWTGIHLPWPDTGPPILWEIPSSQGFSGFAIVDGRIYTQCQNRGGQYVICLELDTGEQLWRSRYGWPWENNGKWPGPYASPTYSNGKVYFTGCYGCAGCMDANNGEIIWSLKLDDDLGGEIPGFGYACTPLVENGKVYLAISGNGCSMVALDADDGHVVWMAGDDSVSYSSCSMIKVDGRNQLVALLENVNIGRDPETGAELWRFKWSDNYDPQCTWPLYEEPYLFRSSPFRGGARVLQLTRTGGQPLVEQAWESKVLSSCIFSGVVVSGFIYSFDVRSPQTAPEGGTKGTFKCVELATGIEQWNTDRVAHSSVLACGGKLILLSELGTLVIAEANPRAYTELARWPLMPGQLCWTIPALHEGYLLVRGRESIVCAYLGDPSAVEGRASSRKADKQSLAGLLRQWLDRHEDYSFLTPSPADLGRWYLFCIFGVFMPIFVIAWLARRRRRLSVTLFFLLSPLLAMTNMFVLTTLFDGFAFTWPAGLYALLLLTILSGKATSKTRSRAWMILSRIVLVMFGLLCAGYSFACYRMFLVAGQGFLVGLAPALPLTYLTARCILNDSPMGRTWVMGLISFSVYFWTSALIILWRTSG